MLHTSILPNYFFPNTAGINIKKQKAKVIPKTHVPYMYLASF